jgi:hypothetical protein
VLCLPAIAGSGADAPWTSSGRDVLAMLVTGVISAAGPITLALIFLVDGTSARSSVYAVNLLPFRAAALD